jgi:hypothetical protein
MQTHINNAGNYEEAKRQITMDTKNSYLPKLSAEMARYQFCRLTRREYSPNFNREEHLKDIINLHGKNHKLLTSAVKQSCFLADLSIKQLLGERKTIEMAKTELQQNQKTLIHKRK